MLFFLVVEGHAAFVFGNVVPNARTMKCIEMAIAATWVIALIFWFAMAHYLGVKEPWDSSAFWTLAYPAALTLSAVLGFNQTGSKWVVGAIVIFAQVPVVLAMPGDASLLGVGVLYAAVLAVPAMGVSWVAGTVRRRLGS